MQENQKCEDCGIPKSEVLKRHGRHGDTCQNEGRTNLVWGLAHMVGDNYVYRGGLRLV